MKLCVSARLAEPGRFSATSRSAAVFGRLLDDAAAAAGHFGDLLRSEMMQNLIERGLHGRQRCELFDQPVADLDRFARLHGLAVQR